MAKYSYEFKKQVVEAYLSGEGGYEYLAKRYGVPSWSNIKKWVRNYETHGDKGLMRSRKQDKYSFEKKLSVVELYLASELSYQELALREGIYNPSQICKWVKDFQIAGPDALRPHKKGRRKTLGTSNKKLNIEQDTTTVPVDTSTEHVKELVDDVDINRSTFYLHYSDIPSLLKEIEDDIFRLIAGCYLIYYLHYFMGLP